MGSLKEARCMFGIASRRGDSASGGEEGGGASGESM